jgi:DHA1 family inner membrane transport protein
MGVDAPDAAARVSAGPRWRSHAAVLAFGTFVVGTDAFVIAGVLPDIARSLDVGIGAAGQLVSVFAIAYAVLSPVLAALTAQWSRRTVLVSALLVLSAGNIATALAPGYALVLAARVVAAAGAAMYTPNAGATAAAMAGEKHRGQAFAMVNMGLSSSLVLGAPLGTAIGGALGWRATMWFVTALAFLVAPLLAFRLPAVRLAVAAGLLQRLAPLRDRRVLRVLLITVIAFIGIFVPYTYISAVYSPVTAGQGDLLTVLLLVFGTAGTAGNLAAGHIADRQGPRRVVMFVTLALAAVFVIAVAARGSLATALPIIVLSGALSWSVLTPQQHRIIALAPDAQALVVSLNATGVYLGVSLAGVIGAVGLDLVGAAWLPALAAGMLVIAAMTTWWPERGPAGDTYRPRTRSA